MSDTIVWRGSWEDWVWDGEDEYPVEAKVCVTFTPETGVLTVGIDEYVEVEQFTVASFAQRMGISPEVLRAAAEELEA